MLLFSNTTYYRSPISIKSVLKWTSSFLNNCLCASWYETTFHKYLVKTQAQCKKLILSKKLCPPIARSHICHGLRLTASSPCNNELKSFLKSYSYFQTTVFSVSPQNIQICSFIINISANLKENKSGENTAEVHEKFEFINFYFFLAFLPSLQHLYSPLTQWSITLYKGVL